MLQHLSLAHLAKAAYFCALMPFGKPSLPALNILLSAVIWRGESLVSLWCCQNWVFWKIISILDSASSCAAISVSINHVSQDVISNALESSSSLTSQQLAWFNNSFSVDSNSQPIPGTGAMFSNNKIIIENIRNTVKTLDTHQVEFNDCDWLFPIRFDEITYSSPNAFNAKAVFWNQIT